MKFCLFTIFNARYQPYFPIWEYCLQRAYPEYERVAMAVDHPDPNITAAMRFTALDWEAQLSAYDYVLYTDIDILHFREKVPILERHLNNLLQWKTECYDNLEGPPGKMSGMHFITREWWDRTRIARRQAAERIAAGGCEWGDDEEILYRIVKESHLPISRRRGAANIHGIHLGAFRRHLLKPNAVNLDAWQSLFREEILKDQGFLDLAEKASQKSEEIAEIIKAFKKSGGLTT